MSQQKTDNKPTKIERIRPTIKQLMHFRPIDTFTEQQLILVSANSIVKSYEKNQLVLEAGSHDKIEYFLLKGRVELVSIDGRTKEIAADSDSAQAAVALLQPRKYTVRTKTPCQFILVRQSTVSTFLKEIPNESTIQFSVSDHHSGHELGDIERSFEHDLKNNTLKIPSFPDVAMRIKGLLDDPNTTVKDIASVLNNDPAITVKLLRTCNSPLYRTAKEVTSSSDAIVRLGFDTTRQLVTIFVMKELFQSKNKYLQEKMRHLWLHSREVASFAYVLASITPGMNPEHAMLAGLIQDIGTIPILNYIESYPDYMKLDYKVDGIITKLKRKVGCDLLQKWDFQADLIEVAENSQNWAYASAGDKPTYADITIAAQVHTFIGKKEQSELPPFNTIPAFKKLGDGGLTPEQSKDVLQRSHRQIDDIQALLSPEPIPVLS